MGQTHALDLTKVALILFILNQHTVLHGVCVLRECKNLPETKNEVAALGLDASLRLTEGRTGRERLCIENEFSMVIGCNYRELVEYRRSSGLPENLVDQALVFFKEKRIPVAKHQLLPTKKILITYNIINS